MDDINPQKIAWWSEPFDNRIRQELRASVEVASPKKKNCSRPLAVGVDTGANKMRTAALWAIKRLC